MPRVVTPCQSWPRSPANGIPPWPPGMAARMSAPPAWHLAAPATAVRSTRARRALNYSGLWGAPGPVGPPVGAGVAAGGMCLAEPQCFSGVARVLVGFCWPFWDGRAAGAGLPAPRAGVLGGDLPSAGGAGQAGGAQLSQVDPAGPEFEPGIVLGHAAVAESAGAG